MKEYKKIEIEDLQLNPWQTIGEDWLVVSAGGKKLHNATTVCCGSFGVHWNMPTVTILLRAQGYTKGFVEKREKFSVSIMPKTDEMKDKLLYLGQVSGRDEDKMKKVGLNYNRIDKFPSVAEAEYVINCEVIYRDQIQKAHFADSSIPKEHYPDKDYHYTYIGKIVSVYQAVEEETETEIKE